MDAFASLQPVDREATSSIIASAIRRGIMDGSFPPGMQLGEVQLARSFGVSRGPVREAIQRLVQEGLLRNERHRGVFVITLDENDVRDVYRARRALERAAAADLVRDASPAVFEKLATLVHQMEQALASGSWQDIMEHDLQFHRVMVEGSGSERLSRMFDSLLVETRMCLAKLETFYPRRSPIVAEHRVLLEALKSSDTERALRCVDEHLLHAVTNLASRGAEHGQLSHDSQSPPVAGAFS